MRSIMAHRHDLVASRNHAFSSGEKAWLREANDNLVEGQSTTNLLLCRIQNNKVYWRRCELAVLFDTTNIKPAKLRTLYSAGVGVIVQQLSFHYNLSSGFWRIATMTHKHCRSQGRKPWSFFPPQHYVERDRISRSWLRRMRSYTTIAKLR